MKKFKDSSNYIYMLDHTDQHCGQQTNGEVKPGSQKISQNLSQNAEEMNHRDAENKHLKSLTSKIS